jgi:hypothetical protein
VAGVAGVEPVGSNEGDVQFALGFEAIAEHSLLVKWNGYSIQEDSPMSRIGEWLDEQAEDEVLTFLLENEGEYLQGPAVGIARQVMRDGKRSLSERQLFVFDRYIGPYLELECRRCHIEIPACEIVHALSDGGLCGWCNHQAGKLDD